jgi:hypothetical protein
MENTNRSSTYRIGIYITGSLLAAVMIYYLVMSMLSPAARIEEINKEYGYKPDPKSKIDERIFSDSSFIAMNRQKSYYQARVNMAETDSICLALNLADSTATLEISGVAVHKVKLTGISVCKVLRNADEYALTSLLAAPLTIENDISSVKKEPVMIKIAPKDTSEYKPDILPDTTRSEAVNYIFEMSGGLRIYVYQSADENEKGRSNIFSFDLADRMRNISGNLSSIIRFKIPEYHPYIKLRMKKSDARIIYRALPRHGLISVYR